MLQNKVNVLLDKVLVKVKYILMGCLQCLQISLPLQLTAGMVLMGNRLCIMVTHLPQKSCLKMLLRQSTNTHLPKLSK